MDLSDQIHDFLAGITLADMVNRPEVLDISRRQESRASMKKRVITSSIPLNNY
jgi:Rrf2 family iron-sulfur cluster assembly transcriptional regulator